MSDYNAAQSRAKRPCPLWVDAFQRDTQHLEADEVGAYMLILMAMWTRESCDFPDSDSRLARVSRVSVRLWNSRIGPVIREFLTAENGVVLSKRLREEATYVERTVTKQHDRKKPQKSGKPLESNDVGLTADEPREVPRGHPTQQPNNPTDNSEDKSSSLSPGDDDGYSEFLKSHPKPRENSRGESAWGNAMAAGQSAQSLIAAAARYAQISAEYDRGKVQFSDNWLADGSWEKYPAAEGVAPVTPEQRAAAIASMLASNSPAVRAQGLKMQEAAE